MNVVQNKVRCKKLSGEGGGGKLNLSTEEQRAFSIELSETTAQLRTLQVVINNGGIKGKDV